MAPVIVPTVANVGLTFPIAVLNLEDAATLSNAKLVVLVADGPDAETGDPLTVCPRVHGEAVVAWTIESLFDLLVREDLSEDVDGLLNDYPAFVMCGYRVAEMLLDEQVSIDRGILLKGSPSVDDAVFLDSNDLRLVLHSGHDTMSCRCARGQMVPFAAIAESLMQDDDIEGR
jgi:hypothetical protein